MAPMTTPPAAFPAPSAPSPTAPEPAGPVWSFLGPTGTFSEMALRQVAPAGVVLDPCPDVPTALDRVRNRRAEAAVVPIENSVEGGVNATLDSLVASKPLVITAEVAVPITFVLAGLEGTRLEDVRGISTHPHAWAQCRGWVHRNLPDAVYVAGTSTSAPAKALAAAGGLLPSSGDDAVAGAPSALSPAAGAGREGGASTGGAGAAGAAGPAGGAGTDSARGAGAGKGRGARTPSDLDFQAVLCNPLAAEQYGLTVLAGGVADNPGAVTRFVKVTLPGRVGEPTGADKTTLQVQLPHDRAGALLGMLEQFSARGVNLSRIESRPVGDSLGRYRFSLDIEGHIREERVQAALIGLHRTCPQVRFLGSYPRLDARPVIVPAGTSDKDFTVARAWVADVLDGRVV